MCTSPRHPVRSTPASKGLSHPAEHPPFSSSSGEQRMRLQQKRNPCWAALPGILTALEENQMSVCSHPSGRKQQWDEKGEDGLGLGWKIKRGFIKKRATKAILWCHLVIGLHSVVLGPRAVIFQGTRTGGGPRWEPIRATNCEAHSHLPGSERCDSGSDTAVADCNTGSR